MYIFKNAFKNIIRSKGRNILIGIIIIVIAAACSITLAIRNSANKIVESYKGQYQIEATIGMDRSSMMNNIKGEDGENSQEEMINAFNDIKSVTVDEIKEYGASEYVSNYYYYYEISMDAKDLTEATDSLVKETTETKTNTQTFKMPGGGMPGGFNPGNYQKKSTTTTKKTEKIFNEKAENGAYSIIGYSSLESMTDFINGSKTITDGAIFTDFSEEGNGAIISKELAELNDLKVGDTITLVNPEHTKKTYKIEITGIYEESDNTSNDMTSMFTNSANTIIVSSLFTEKIISDDDDISVTVTPTFIIKDEESVSKFATEVKEKGLSEYYKVTDNLDIVENATKSITSVKNFAVTFLVITLIIGGVVLFVINMINIRERKYEIGVLRTIGMSKVKVILEFIVEIFIVSLVSLLIGAGIGATTSVKIANNLLSSEIENASSNKDDIKNNFGGGEFNFDFKNMNGVVNIEQVDNINAVVDFVVIFELLGIGLFLTLISGISACVSIARFQPLTILKERS